MSPAEAQTTEPAVRRRGPARVLVIDDEPDTVITLLTILRDEGYEAKGFSHPLEALKSLPEFDPDVVISDIAMPLMSGWELAKKVREKMGKARPVMIAISGVYQKGLDKVLASTSGYAFFLAKPCDPDVVVTLIEKAIASGQA